MTEPLIRNAFLPQQRGFPTDEPDLQKALYKSYIDIAQAVNYRVIGLFERVQTGTGEQWFNDGLSQNDVANLTRRQSYRKVVTIDSLVSGSYPHGVDFDSEMTFTRIYGTATDSVNLLAIPIPYVDFAGVDNVQISVTATDIVIVTSAAWAAYTAVLIIEFIPIGR